MGAPLADPAPPLPVGRQESRHLLRKLSDDHHHLMAPERQRGPRVQRLRPLLQAAQCESPARPPRPSPGTSGFVRPGLPAPAWLGLGSQRQKGFPRGGRACWRTPPVVGHLCSEAKPAVGGRLSRQGGRKNPGGQWALGRAPLGQAGGVVWPGGELWPLSALCVAP